MFATTMTSTSVSNHGSLKDGMNELRAQWNALNSELNSTKSHLNVSRSRWEDFHSALESLITSLNSLGDKIEMKYQSNGELAEMKAFLEK